MAPNEAGATVGPLPPETPKKRSAVGRVIKRAMPRASPMLAAAKLYDRTALGTVASTGYNILQLSSGPFTPLLHAGNGMRVGSGHSLCLCGAWKYYPQGVTSSAPSSKTSASTRRTRSARARTPSGEHGGAKSKASELPARLALSMRSSSSVALHATPTGWLWAPPGTPFAARRSRR